MIKMNLKKALFALAMLFALPGSLMAAGENWDGVLDALHNRQLPSVKHISHQNRIILEAGMLIKAHRSDQAMHVLNDGTDGPLIRQLKRQADRERLYEAVNKAGGTRSEVHLPPPTDALKKALAEVDLRLQTFMLSLSAQDMNAGKPSDRMDQPVEHTKLAADGAIHPAQASLPDRWSDALNQLQHNTLKPVRHLSKQERAIMQVALLLKLKKPEQAASILETQPATQQVKHLNIKVSRERIVQAVRKAGGSRSEMHLPPAPEGMDATLAAVDGRLQILMQQLDYYSSSEAVNGGSTVAAALAEKTRHVATSYPPAKAELRGVVLASVEAWRSSWSNRDLNTYFSIYANDFEVPERFASMDGWKSYKRWVIGKRESIQVLLENIKAYALSNGQVRVEFVQHFQTDGYQSIDLKALTLRQFDGSWKIINEESV